MTLVDVAVIGGAEIETGDGLDRVHISSIGEVLSPGDPAESSFSDLEVNLGQHDDELAIGDLFGIGVGVVVTGELEVESGKGNDQIHPLSHSVS